MPSPNGKAIYPRKPRWGWILLSLPCEQGLHVDLGQVCLAMLSPHDTGSVSWGWVKTRRKKCVLSPGRVLPASAHVSTPYRFWCFLGKSFREQQCEKYNAYNYTDMDGNLLQWVPKYSGVSPRDRCKLFCRARGRSEFKVFEAKVRIPREVRATDWEEGHLPPAWGCLCAHHALSSLPCPSPSPVTGDRRHPVWAGDSGHLCPGPVCQGWMRPRGGLT